MTELEENEIISLFEAIGLSNQKALETKNNKKLCPNLINAIQSFGSIDNLDKTTGALIYNLASLITKDSVKHLPYISVCIRDKKLLSSDQILAAIKFCEDVDGEINDEEFNRYCGVGVEVSQEEIAEAVGEFFKLKKKELIEKRYTMLGPILGTLRTTIKWANPLLVKEEVEKRMLELLGPKDERDDLKAKKKEKKKENVNVKGAEIVTAPQISMAERAKTLKFVFEGELAKLHKAGENKQINPQLMKDHLKRTKGKVITRFPPEPNGFLHIGHAKAINVNFAYAEAFKGETNLRYDDTNPEAEEDQYFQSILKSIEWLGCKPTRVTYSSDHFQKLYELAIVLTKKDKAYVCHCTAQQMHEGRGGDTKGERKGCIHRDRPVEESLTEFRKMKEGFYAEGEATLRMKMDMNNPNPQFWDLVAYRVLYTHHVRTKDEWCIYPTYDYTHCLVDSFEDITHSMCTVEFVMSRESYYWLIDALEIYKPVQWEYGRLKLTNTVLSKRKLNKLVTEKYVAGWDDPRLHTLDALRRRGFTPEAINAFVRELGVTTTNSTIEMSKLEKVVRDHLNEVAPRLMVVLDPLRVTLTNLPYGHVEELELKEKDGSTHLVPFSKVVYIDRSDFSEEDDPNFFRLKKGMSVGLLQVPHPITCNEVIKDSKGKIIELKCNYDKDVKFVKPKTYIQWVGESSRHQSPIPVEIRLYSNLFHHSDPDNKEQVPGGWLSDINEESLQVKNGFMEVGIRHQLVPENKFQFLRIGYFCIDKDSDFEKNKYVFNRTVGLKEDSRKDK
ncbi:hypothetical protein HK099_003408 [Clydaea vesicula]|uniref:Probable glutamate--tRNA ligase, cytoplasmic n=1 Tax=Clydaea vesicula TaxID=447962 RepID=A0AAD5U235_9FUNG|nr:hypothetical protein HK099_003408 [Clydaea vesicula]